MKPLFPIVVAILVAAITAHPEAKDVKELSKSKEPLVEAEGSEPQARKERCTTCSNSLKSKNELFQAIKSLPNAEVHTQESFEGCSSEKGCAGLKVKDGKVIEKFGNLQAFKAAAAADNANDFQFQAAGNSVFDAGVANGGPYWWMNQQNSPFKNGAAAGGGSFEKFSKSSSSFTSSSNGGAGGVDLAANPFLNGDFAKLGAGFNGGSNFGSSQSEIDITKNQFSSGQSGFGSQAGSQFGGNQGGFAANAQGFGANSQSGFGASGQGVGLSQGSQGSGSGFGSGQSGFNSFNAAGKFGSGYTGSSPAPFTPTGSNVNLIANGQKNEFDYNQQTQQSIDEIFQSTGNVQAHDNSGGDLQQTCAGQGYVCVLKSQCNNGVVNTNGGGLLQANTQKQYCNTRTEICCRIETAALAGAGSLQGSLGVGSATYSGNQGSGLFSQGSQSNQNTQNSFGASGFGASNQGASNTGFNAVNRGSTGFGSNQFGGSSFGTNKFASTTGSGFGSTVAPNRNFNNEVFKSTSQSNFVETDSFSSGSDNAGVYRPGSVGTGLKPGIPYLPPVEPTSSGSNVVTSAYTPAFVTTPRPFSTPRPTPPRVFTTPKPTYLPPISTKAPEYLPPVDGYTALQSFPVPQYVDGQLILDQTIPEAIPINNDVPSGCAAALKCTPIEFCTAEGVISNTTVILSRDQEAYRVPLTDCKDLGSGRIGKCCRDPFYTDPWPTNQLGKWVPNVFGGNDGKYVPDSRGSSNNPPGVTVRPPVTGSVLLNNFQTTSKPTVTRGYPTTSTPFVKNQYGSGSYGQGERGTYQGTQGYASTGNAFSNTGQNAFASNVGKKAFSQGSQTGLTGFSQGANTNAFAQGANTNAFSRGTQNSLTGFSQGAQNTNSLSRGTQNSLTGFSRGGQNTNSLSRGTQNSLTGFSQGAQNTNSVSRGAQSGVGFQGAQNTNSLSRGTQNSLTGFSQGAQNTNAFSQGAQNTNAFSQGAQNTNSLSRGSQTGGFAQGTQNTNAFSQGSQNGLGAQNTNAFAQGAAQNANAFSRGAQNGLTGFSQGAQNTNAFAQGSQNAFSQSGQSAFSGGAQNAFAQGGQSAQGAQGFGSGAQGQGSASGVGNQVTSTQYDQGSYTQGGRGQYEVGGKGTQVQTGGGFGVQTGGGFRTQQGGGGSISQGGGGSISQGGGGSISQGGGGSFSQGGGGSISQGGGGFEVQTGGGGAIQQGGGFRTQQGGGGSVQTGGGFEVQTGGGGAIQQGGGFRTQQGGGGFGVQTGGGGFGLQSGGGSFQTGGGGFGVQRGQGQAIITGQGQKLIQGVGEKITQEIVTGVKRGGGFTVQNGGFGVENEFGESIQRVYLPKYIGSGQCGTVNPQKPYGNHKDLELDFAEVPWQAMVLLQTNRSLLCGGVITRPDVVITSASCVEGLQAKNVLIKGGEWKLGIDDEPLPFQIVQVKHILRHPQYQVGVLKYDAAVLVLTENLRLAKNIWPICLPQPPAADESLEALYNGAGKCIVTGWGKSVLQAHLEGSIIHGVNVSLLNPGDCQNKISQEYPHLLDHYDQKSCVCGQPTNPANNICKVDIGSALACTEGNNQYTLRGIYSWDSGCQVGNQLAGFYKFDMEWYEWAIGTIESVRFEQYTTTKVIKNKVSSQVSGVKYGGGVKGSSGIKGTVTSGASAISGSGFGVGSQSGEYSQFGATKFGSGSTNFGSGLTKFGSGSTNFGSGSTKFGSGSASFGTGSDNFGTGSTKFSESGEYNQEIKGPIQKTFSATYTEKKFFQTEPKYVTYTTKPEIVTYTTKPEYFTYTTKPKIVTYTTKPEIVTYTTKPEIIRYTTKPKIVSYTTKPEIITYTTKPQIIRYDYQTSGSQTNQQIVPPSVSFNPSFTEVVGSKHIHDAKCKCLENGKK